MKVGYFAIPFQSADAFVNFDILRQQESLKNLKISSHVRFKAPLTVWMDGKKQTSVVTYYRKFYIQVKIINFAHTLNQLKIFET